MLCISKGGTPSALSQGPVWAQTKPSQAGMSLPMLESSEALRAQSSESSSASGSVWLLQAVVYLGSPYPTSMGCLKGRGCPPHRIHPHISPAPFPSGQLGCGGDSSRIAAPQSSQGTSQPPSMCSCLQCQGRAQPQGAAGEGKGLGSRAEAARQALHFREKNLHSLENTAQKLHLHSAQWSSLIIYSSR